MGNSTGNYCGISSFSDKSIFSLDAPYTIGTLALKRRKIRARCHTVNSVYDQFGPYFMFFTIIGHKSREIAKNRGLVVVGAKDGQGIRPEYLVRYAPFSSKSNGDAGAHTRFALNLKFCVLCFGHFLHQRQAKADAFVFTAKPCVYLLKRH